MTTWLVLVMALLLGMFLGAGLVALFLKRQQKQQEQDQKTLSLENMRLKTQLEHWHDGQWQQQFEAMGNKALAQWSASLLSTQELHFKHEAEKVLEPLRQLVIKSETEARTLGQQTLRETVGLKTQLDEHKALTAKLANALSDSKGKGNWGELRLQRLLELSGLSHRIDFDLQATIENTADDQKKRIPDCRICLPNGRYVYIDAKTLLEPLMAIEQQPENRKRLTQAFKREVLGLHQKAYHVQDPASVDFMVLYVPIESLLRIPLEEDPNLLEEAFAKGVILASPLILMTLLKTIEKNWQQADLHENALSIQKLAQELHQYAITFLEHFEGIEKGLQTAQTAYQKAVKSLQSRLVPKLKALESKHFSSEKSIPKTFEAPDVVSDVVYVQ